MSSNSSDASSSRSPSPSNASEHQEHHEPPTLERLVSHFVSSKRALSSTSSVWRANELVTTSRALLEEIALLNAKTIFARAGVDEQVDTLREIRDGISSAADSAGDEFRATIEKLDLANERLEKTLSELRNTAVDPALHRTPAALESNLQSQTDADEENDNDDDDYDDDDDDGRPVKTLYHYIDETRHESLRASLRAHIDTFNDARADLDDSLTRLDSSLRTISTTLASATSRRRHHPHGNNAPNVGPEDKSTLYDDLAPSIPELFHGMEDHAAEMANLLQSLVSHYDLCLTALKHTEGGGKAAARALVAADLPATNPSDPEASLYATAADPEQPASSTTTAAATMDEAERAELLRVLENDAAELGDVLAELRERSSAIESQYSQLQRRARRARAAHAGLRDVLRMLRDVRDVDLPAHRHALQTFGGEWEVDRLGIVGKTGEVVALCDFHEAFLGDYGRVLGEVRRREGARRAVRKVAEKAAREIGRLEAVDRGAREEFLEEVGRYLPVDLWPAMKDEAVRWEVRALAPARQAGGEEDGEGGG